MSTKVTAILTAGRLQSGTQRGTLEYDVNEELMSELSSTEVQQFKLVLMRAMQRLARETRGRETSKPV